MVENPYVTSGGYVSLPAGAPFVDRSQRAPGLIHGSGPVVAAFADGGWEWGGQLVLADGLPALLGGWQLPALRYTGAV